VATESLHDSERTVQTVLAADGGGAARFKTACCNCGVEMAKIDDARRERSDGTVEYECDNCAEARISEMDPTARERECLCGATIPPFGEHREWEPNCRHCQNTLLNYRDRELAEEDGHKDHRESDEHGAETPREGDR
jgi:hypothetical protein